MINLKEVTFNIPIRIESEDRKNNLICVLNYFKKHLDTNVIICEFDSESKIKTFWNTDWNSFCTLIFIKQTTEKFHKTKLLNIMAVQAKTPYIVSYDSDILFFPEQYLNAYNSLKSNQFDFCYPFSTALRNIPKEHLSTLSNTLELSSVDGLTKIEHPLPPPGGCFFINKEKFIKAGMENENLISWGPEDVERRDRLISLGYKVGSLAGPIFHMEHSRTSNSTSEHELFKHNENEYSKIKSMNPLQLKYYVDTWKWKQNALR